MKKKHVVFVFTGRAATVFAAIARLAAREDPAAAAGVRLT